MRVVVDTNIIISGLFWKGSPEKVYSAAILACAVGGNADVIVSGDKDLLVLQAYQSIPIVNAAQFLERLAGE